MLILLLAAPLLVDPASLLPWREPGCNERLAYTAAQVGVEARKLGELPRGLAMLAIDKRVAGCAVTVLPQRDETGQHLMMRTPGARVTLAPARSKPQRRLQRDR